MNRFYRCSFFPISASFPKEAFFLSVENNVPMTIVFIQLHKWSSLTIEWIFQIFEHDILLVK